MNNYSFLLLTTKIKHVIFKRGGKKWRINVSVMNIYKE